MSLIAAEETSTTKKYHEQFSLPEADIVCVSKDEVYFRVPSLTLRMTSGFFRSTLALPNPNAQDSKHETDPIFLPEPSLVIERLLRIVCGLGLPSASLQTLEEVTDLLHAADNYEMPGVISFLQTLIVHPRFLNDHPLQVYQMSCRYGWTAEMKMASTLTLPFDLTSPTYLPVLSTLPATDLMALMHFRWNRRAMLKARLDALAGSREPFTCESCGVRIDPYTWVIWKHLILEEFAKDASGKSILSQEFLSTEKANAVFQQRCNNPMLGCNKVLFNRQLTIRDVRAAIDSLPSTV